MAASCPGGVLAPSPTPKRIFTRVSFPITHACLSQRARAASCARGQVLLASTLAVVDPVDGAVDGGRGIAGKEGDHIRNVKGLHHAAWRGRAHDQVIVRVVRRTELFDLRGEHAARTYGVDTQAICAVLHRQSASEPNQPVFGSAVAGRVGLAFDAGYRADIDDVAAALQLMGQCSPAE